jgi:hypothetical protein
VSARGTEEFLLRYPAREASHDRRCETMKSQAYRRMLEVMIKRGGPYAGADIPEFFEMV